MSDIGNPRGTNEDLGSDVRHCFCCRKEFDRNKLDTIDGRYVCKSCNHLSKKGDKDAVHQAKEKKRVK